MCSRNETNFDNATILGKMEGSLAGKSKSWRNDSEAFKGVVSDGINRFCYKSVKRFKSTLEGYESFARISL